MIVQFAWRGVDCEVWRVGDVWRVQVRRPDGSGYVGEAATRKAAVARAKQVAHAALRPPRRTIDAQGYIVTRDGYEHRLVLERKLGRGLLPTETVHHLNGDKTDNRPENLVAMDRGEHVALHNRTAPKRARRRTPRVPSNTNGAPSQDTPFGGDSVC